MNKSTQSEKIDVGYVANLARLNLTEQEIEVYQKQIEEIINYVKQLQTLPLDNVEPLSYVMPMVNVFREDQTSKCLEREQVLANAPAVLNHQFLVPKIVE